MSQQQQQQQQQQKGRKQTSFRGNWFCLPEESKNSQSSAALELVVYPLQVFCSPVDLINVLHVELSKSVFLSWVQSDLAVHQFGGPNEAESDCVKINDQRGENTTRLTSLVLMWPCGRHVVVSYRRLVSQRWPPLADFVVTLVGCLV